MHAPFHYDYLSLDTKTSELYLRAAPEAAVGVHVASLAARIHGPSVKQHL